MNAISPQLDQPYADKGAMSRSRVLGAYFAEVRYELVHTIRSPNVLVFSVAFPLMFYLLVGFVFGPFRAEDPNVRAYVLIGFILLATMTPGFVNFAGALAVERERGLHTLRRALPMPGGANVAAKTVMALLCVAIVIPALVATGMLLGNVELSPVQALRVFGLGLFGALPFCALGCFIGMHVSGRAATAIINITFIPMLYLSGAFVPLPEGLAWISVLTPPFYLQQLMLSAAGAPHQFLTSSLLHWAVLAVLTGVFAVLTMRRFRVAG